MIEIKRTNKVYKGVASLDAGDTFLLNDYLYIIVELGIEVTEVFNLSLLENDNISTDEHVQVVECTLEIKE